MPDSANGGRNWKSSPWLGLIPAAIAFIVMAFLSWRKWPDPIVDFGGQLYIPWQLSTGSVLYRDVMYLPGPVSQYYHALLFKVFGVSLNAILVSNFLILIFFVGFVYRLFLRCADRLTASVMALAVVAGFAFAQYLDVGNYNYLCPYSHEIWHGIVLAVVMIGCIANWVKDSKGVWLMLCGFCYGLIFLMKPENFVAATAIVGVGILFKQDIRTSLKALGQILLATMFPLVGMFFVFFAGEDARSSLLGMCGGWVPLVTTKMAGGTFFKTGMGMDVPAYHLGLMVKHFCVFAGVVALCAWRFRENQHRIERLVLFCVLAGGVLNFDWTHCGRSLPLILLASIGTFYLSWRKSTADERYALLVPFLWTIFALLLLLKMGLFPRIVHYGVFLGMPAFLAAIFFLLWLLPRTFSWIDATRFRPVVVALLMIALARLAIHSSLFYKDKDYAIGQGGDRIITYNPKVSPAGQCVDQAVAWIRENTSETATVAALPEGVMINYLSRRRNPTPYIVFMSEIYAFGEEKMAAPYRATPPDYLLLVHRETGEYGLDFFGRKKGYGKEMLEWINAHYETVALFGAEPLKTTEFGVKILKKNNSP